MKLVFFKKNLLVVQVNWLLHEEKLDDRQIVRNLNLDSNLALQQIQTISKKPLHHTLKIKKSVLTKIRARERISLEKVPGRHKQVSSL